MSAVSTPVGEAGLHETAARPSPAGPAEDQSPTRMPPVRGRSRFVQSIRFVANPLSMNLRAREEFGDVWQLMLLSRKDPFVVTSHPDHVKSLLTAKPLDAPSLTGESPLRPILGPNSVLTSVGARHMRQRKLLLPPFHGEAVERHVEMIAAVAEATVPKVSVIVRKAYGAGLYAMSGPAFDTNATLALPTAMIGVMGPSAAVNAVFYNKIQEVPEAERAAYVKKLQEEYREDIDLYRLASDLIVDAVVAPQDLRTELAARFARYATSQRPRVNRKHGVFPV